METLKCFLETFESPPFEIIPDEDPTSLTLLFRDDIVFTVSVIPGDETLIFSPLKNSRNLKEKVLCKAIESRNLRTVNDLFDILDLIDQRADNLTDYCLFCCEILEHSSDTFMPCGNDSCIILSEETLYDDYVMEKYRESPEVIEFLLVTALDAMRSKRREQIYEPFPLCASKVPDVTIINRGVVTSLEGIDINYNKDFELLDQKTKDFTTAADILNTIKHTTNSDLALHDVLGEFMYKWVKFSIKTNKTDLRFIEDSNGLYHFGITHHPTVEESFNAVKMEKGSCYLFHGSSTENWYSIVRNGVKICSHSKLMVNAAAYGKGIYLSDDITCSYSYSTFRSQNSAHTIFAVFEVIGQQNDYKKRRGIFLVNDDKLLLLRHLFFGKRKVLKSDIMKYLNDEVNGNLEKEEKEALIVSNSIRDKRLSKELKKVLKIDPAETGFYVDPHDDISIWRVFIVNIDCETLRADLESINVPHIELEVRFPEQYPAEPPFVRIVHPRFTFRTGHITIGGSICMELLTPQGWSPVYSMENMMMHIISLIIEGGGRLDRKCSAPYTYEEAKKSFYRVASAHGWL